LTRVALCVAVLTCSSSAPFVQFSIRIAKDGLSRGGWPYVYGYAGSAALAVGLFAVDVVPKLRERSRLVWFAPLGMFGLWALASATWTGSPLETPTEVMLMSSFLLFGPWFGSALSRLEQAVSLFVVTQTLTLTSLAFAVVAPNSATSLGDWIGVFASRNTLGPIACLAALVVIGCVMSVERTVGRWVLGGVFVVADLFVAYQAGSDTAVLGLASAVLAAMIIVPGVWHRRDGSVAMLAATCAAAVGVVWVAFFRFVGPITSALGKDPTLSDRRTIWSYLRSQISERPIRGFGYGSFWDDPERVYPLYELTGSVYGSAHSSFMETWLWLGLVGVGLLAVLLVQAAARVGAIVWSGSNLGTSAGVVAVGIFVLMENLTESMISLHSLFWTLLVGAAFIEPESSRDGSDSELRQSDGAPAVIEPSLLADR
jgi:exopolysaccharide production protein ExoQ